LTNFHKLTGKDGKLTCPSNAQYHTCSQERVFEFQNRSTSGSEHDIRSTIQNNRRTLKPIIETVLLYARQNMSLRGHRDSGRIFSVKDPDVNDGNFRALLRFRCRSGDEILTEFVGWTR
jgi:hypothetical protein